MNRFWNTDVVPSQITPEAVWRSRRRFVQGAGLGALALGAPSAVLAADATPRGPELQAKRNPRWSIDESPNSWQDITGYNNFYEFGTAKADPARYAGNLRLEPWTLRIDGAVKRPMTLDIDALHKLAAMEERIYRLRCVEAWSMVVPWSGYALSHLLRHVEPTSAAKYVVFTTALQPDAMPGVKSSILNWPYTEGLRLDEALHPLTLLTFGVYGRTLPAQNGAPLRVIVPWKYGFKSAKSLVRIHLQSEPPVTSWMRAAPREYGFYANVNPDVPHPRWSQATERQIGAGLFASRIPTKPFNGYANEVAALYQGMDLRTNF